MNKEITPVTVYKEYTEGEDYLRQINLHENVRKNNEFYNGDQWKGVNAPDLIKPVFNIFRQAIAYLCSQICSDDVGIEISPLEETEETKFQCQVLKNELEKVIEKNKSKSMYRDLIKAFCIDADGAWNTYFDPLSGNSGGEIKTEEVENDKIIVANPFLHGLYEQRYYIVVKRMMLEEAVEHARSKGVSEDDIRRIIPDGDVLYTGEEKDSTKKMVTVLMRYWKETKKPKEGEAIPLIPEKTVHFCECTKTVMIVPPTDSGCRLYPTSFGSWEKKRGSFYGANVMGACLPNQIFINKMWAMAMEYEQRAAFPTRFYNSTYFPNGLSNKVGQAVAVQGEPEKAVWIDSGSGRISSQFSELTDKTIQYTKETIGAYEAALGNIDTSNVSGVAIVAMEKRAAAPLILQQLAGYQFWEDYVNIIGDIIRTNYGVRSIAADVTDPITGEKTRQFMDFDFSSIDYDKLSIKVEIGSSAYWSEISAVETLDALFSKGIINDAIIYLEALPEGKVPNRQKILDALKKQREQNLAMQEQAPIKENKGEALPTGETDFVSSGEGTLAKMPEAGISQLKQKLEEIS